MCFLCRQCGGFRLRDFVDTVASAITRCRDKSVQDADLARWSSSPSSQGIRKSVMRRLDNLLGCISSLPSQMTKEHPYVIDQQLGLFHSSEVASSGHFCPSLYVQGALSPLPYYLVGVFWEQSDGTGNFHSFSLCQHPRTVVQGPSLPT